MLSFVVREHKKMAEFEVPSFFLCKQVLETETFEDLLSGLVFCSFNIVVDDVGVIHFSDEVVERQGQSNLRCLC